MHDHIERGQGSNKAPMVELRLVELRRLEPLPSSVPSTVGLCGGGALRLAISHPRLLLTLLLRGD
jgi:hypothetical protein